MPKPLTISIAMCTYNGERFLQEQLDSFLAQTRLPDELVVCDDGSQDGTVAILEAFAAQAPFPVRLFINPQNLGFSKNFEKAISLCQGDIIALSDQDDVWLPEKLEYFEKIFLDNPIIGLVFCDAIMVDEDLNPLGYSVWDYYGFNFKYSLTFKPGEFTEILFKRSAIAGAMVAFRTVVRDFIVSSANGWVYDQWIPFAASIHVGVAATPKKLNIYRQHGGQCCGLKLYNSIDSFKISISFSRDHYNNLAKKWTNALSHLKSNNKSIVNNKILCAIERKIDHLKTRAQMPRERLKRFPIIFVELITGRYKKFSSGWKSALKDFFWQLG